MLSGRDEAHRVLQARAREASPRLPGVKVDPSQEGEEDVRICPAPSEIAPGATAASAPEEELSMPMIQKRIVLAANAVSSALADDQFEYLPYDALVEFGLLTDATGVLVTIFSGGDLLMDEGPVPLGSAINVFPKYPDDYHLQDVASGGERLKVRLRDTSGAQRIVLVGVRISQIL
jgi:hypothetical protein